MNQNTSLMKQLKSIQNGGKSIAVLNKLATLYNRVGRRIEAVEVLNKEDN